MLARRRRGRLAHMDETCAAAERFLAAMVGPDDLLDQFVEIGP